MDFIPTHRFICDDGAVIEVRVEFRGDYVAWERDEVTPTWFTNLDVMRNYGWGNSSSRRLVSVVQSIGV